MTPTPRRQRHSRGCRSLAARVAVLACAVACVAAQQGAPQMTGPPVPAAWRDKGGPGTVAATLNLTAPRLGELTDAQAAALRKALLATLATPDVPGLDVKRVKQDGTAAPVVVAGAGGAAADRMRVAVDLVAPQARLSDLLRRMQAVSDNAELAGAARAAGLYDLADARFDSYELRAGGGGGGGGGGKAAKAPPEDGGAVIELPPLPPLPKPVAVPAASTPAAPPAPPPEPERSPPPPPPPPSKKAPVTAGIEVSGTALPASDPTPERRAALARAVAVLAGVPEGQVTVTEEGARRRALRRALLQAAAAAAAPWARRFRVEVTPADAAQAATAKTALERLATPAGAADLKAALASQGWDGLAAAGLYGLSGRKVNGVGTGGAPVLKPAAVPPQPPPLEQDGAAAAAAPRGGGGGKLAGIIIGCLVGATLVGLAVAYALAHFLGWCRCLGAGVQGRRDEEKAGGGGWRWARSKTAAGGGGGGAPPAAGPGYKLTDGEEQRAADLRAAAAAAEAGNKAAADGAAVAAAAAAVADDARRDLASIAAAGVTSLRRLASGAKDRAARPGSAGGAAAAAAAGASSSKAITAPASGDAAAAAGAVMDFVRRGAPLAGAFALERGSMVPRSDVVAVKCRELGDPRRPAVASFHVTDDGHARSLARARRLPAGVAPAVLAAYGRGGAPGAPGLPPVVVTEACEYTLGEWVTKRLRTPDPLQRLATLLLTAKPFAALGAKKLVHGAVSPSTVQWFPWDNAMKLADVDGGWAPQGGTVAAHPVPAFAAPEVLAVLARAEVEEGTHTNPQAGGAAPPARPAVPAHPAQDAWALGLLAMYILTDAHPCPVEASASDALTAIGTSGPLPWERPGGALEALDPVAAAAVKGLLTRNPKKRATAAALLGGPLLAGVEAAMAAAAAQAAGGAAGTPRRQ